MEPIPPFLNIYGANPCGRSYIAGSVSGLERAKAAIQAAIDSGKGIAEGLASDGGRSEIRVVRVLPAGGPPRPRTAARDDEDTYFALDLLCYPTPETPPADTEVKPGRGRCGVRDSHATSATWCVLVFIWVASAAASIGSVLFCCR